MESEDSNLRKTNKLKNFFQRFSKKVEVTEDDIRSMVDEETSAEIITNAFEFEDLEVKDVMTHRVNVVGLKADAKLDDIIYIALDEGFSRLPVYGENLDDIIGIIIVKDLLSLVGEKDTSDFKLSDFLRDAVFIPESGSCTGLFKLLKEKRVGMAVVVDEYGGTAGIVTMEDLIEEIMGSIQDEYDDDEEESKIEKIGEEKYAIDGETDPEEVLSLFGYEFPENHEYETLTGFVTDLLGFIPTMAEDEETPYVDYKDLRFVVKEMEDNCIEKVIVFRNEAVKLEKNPR